MKRKGISVWSCILVVIGLACFVFFKQSVGKANPEVGLRTGKTNSEVGLITRKLKAGQVDEKRKNKGGNAGKVTAPKPIVLFDDDQTCNSTGSFYLGMAKDELYQKIKAEKFKKMLDEDHGTEGSSIWCEDFYFMIDADNKVKDIYIYGGPNFRTSKGLKMGDSLKKVEELYGNKYEIREERDATIYQYTLAGNYFLIGVNQAKTVSGWGISRL